MTIISVKTKKSNSSHEVFGVLQSMPRSTYLVVSQPQSMASVLRLVGPHWLVCRFARKNNSVAEQQCTACRTSVVSNVFERLEATWDSPIRMAQIVSLS
jgi:hypothetical protein